MQQQLASRPPGNHTRTAAHRDRLTRETTRLKLQQSTRYVVAIDRHDDEASLNQHQAEAAAARAGFDQDVAALSTFEAHVQQESGEWAAAVAAVKSEKTAFQNGVHIWVLNSMCVPGSMRACALTLVLPVGRVQF